MLGEAAECVAPAVRVRIADGDRLEDGLMQRQPGLAGVLFQAHRQKRFGADGCAVCIVYGTGPDDPLWLDDFSNDAMPPMDIALGRSHLKAVGAALADPTRRAILARLASGESSVRYRPTCRGVKLGTQWALTPKPRFVLTLFRHHRFSRPVASRTGGSDAATGTSAGGGEGSRERQQEIKLLRLWSM